MKIKQNSLRTGLVCVALVLLALCIGSVRGWNKERRTILDAFAAEGTLHAQMEYRGMDAANLAVVVARHLPEDNLCILQLQEASQVLLSSAEDAEGILQADKAITDAALYLAETLPESESVKASQRDLAYITLLTDTLGHKSSLSHSYTLVVKDFNTRLSGSLTGWVAKLLGVDPLPDFRQ